MLERRALAVWAILCLGCGGELSGADAGSHDGLDGGDEVQSDAHVSTDAGLDDGGSSSDACEALTCDALECGAHDDGCGGSIECGMCGDAEACVEGMCVCEPQTCAALGATCGEVDDGCGGILSCGACASGQICGGGGSPNVCGTEPCTPRTCAAAGAQCGATGDGCGGMLSCGGCATDQMCAANRCVARTYEDPTDFSTVSLADPDTLRAEDGRYVTYGTSRAGRSVPYLRHGSGSSVGMSDTIAGDAMPSGAGAWAQGAIWAPGVVRFGGRYFMYYTATKRGTGDPGQKCIGRAVSNSAYGPFTNQREWACPGDGRWAIDPDPIVAGGNLYVTYRDDFINRFPETAIGVVRTDANGFAVWSTHRPLLRSEDVSWETIRNSGSSRIIENPSLFRHDGVWYLAYSGNNWDSVRYATGIARCGTNILPSSRCTPIQNGVARPYFGYAGTGDLDPYRRLPGNRTGPGGMDIFWAADGTPRAVWHFWRSSDRTRHVQIGRLLTNSGGFYIGP